MSNQQSIEKKLTVSIVKVASMAAVAAVVGLIALIVIANRYSYALKNFGFAQGDIGKAMFEFADLRSSLRAAIGYDDEEAIQSVVRQHEEGKVRFQEYFADIEKTIVSQAGRETYSAIQSELEAYWKLDEQIMALGATTDRELCIQAQSMALSELAPIYNSIYSQLDELLSVKVNEGNELSVMLLAVQWILIAVIVAIIVMAMLLSFKIGKGIAKKIADPLKKLGERLKTFAEGDLSSPFPIIETGDEVEIMERDASEMAKHLDVIIFDIGEVLGEMAAGNYAVRSKAAEKYTGDFARLYESMRGLRDQMQKTLIAIGEASN
ncbi:MAG: MCP four helix bundle domain-containing protein, partial [Acetatifactor sp.]|nr:MCP four helix bundle domain-containing protein [Acetatifactor sp.]